MIYGNIYDPNWRNAQLLKELNIDGQGDENEDKTDYTADDDTSSDTANANNGGEENTEGDNPNNAGDNNDTDVDYTADDDTNMDDGVIPDDPAPNDNGGETDYTSDDDTGDTTDNAGGDEGPAPDDGGNTDYTADDDTANDTGDAGEGDPAPADDDNPNDTGETDYTSDDTANDAGGTEGGAAPASGDTGDGDDGGETDYTSDDDTSGGDDSGEDGDQQQDNAGEGSPDAGDADYNLTDDDEQTLAIKNIELKQNYQQMYMTCDDIINKMSQVKKVNDASGVLKRIVNTTTELKKCIEFYLTNTYSTKSYINNVINFQKYLSILNGIRNILNDTCDNCAAESELKEAVASLVDVL